MNFTDIKEIIDFWDPVDLWRSHCPQDEYDEETRKIALLINNINDEKKIAKIIYDVFIDAFNSKQFNHTIEDCLEIAKKILAIQSK
jgi:hypothetical protein